MARCAHLVETDRCKPPGADDPEILRRRPAGRGPHDAGMLRRRPMARLAPYARLGLTGVVGVGLEVVVRRGRVSVAAVTCRAENQGGLAASDLSLGMADPACSPLDPRLPAYVVCQGQCRKTSLFGGGKEVVDIPAAQDMGDPVLFRRPGPRSLFQHEPLACACLESVGVPAHGYLACGWHQGPCREFVRVGRHGCPVRRHRPFGIERFMALPAPGERLAARTFDRGPLSEYFTGGILHGEHRHDHRYCSYCQDRGLFHHSPRMHVIDRRMPHCTNRAAHVQPIQAHIESPAAPLETYGSKREICGAHPALGKAVPDVGGAEPGIQGNEEAARGDDVGGIHVVPDGPGIP